MTGQLIGQLILWLILAVIVIAIAAFWLPRMRKKDRSLSRYPEFADYKKRTTMLIPFVM